MVGEADGFVSIIDSRTGLVRSRFQAAENDVALIAEAPGGKGFCLVDRGGTEIVLRVYAWNAGFAESLFALPLAETPSSLAYSPRGTFIALTDRSLVGFRILNSSDGRILNIPFEAGPAGFATIGASETSFLVYAASGRLSFLSLPEGKVLAESRIQAGLENLRLSRDRKTIFGLKSGRLLAFEALSGKALPTPAELPDLAAFDLDPATDELRALFLDGRLRSGTSVSQARIPGGTKNASLVDAGDGALVLDSSGSPWLYSYAVPGAPLRIEADPFAAINDVSGVSSESKGFFFLALDSGIFVLDPNPLFAQSPEPSFRPLYAETALDRLRTVSVRPVGPDLFAWTTGIGGSELSRIPGAGGEAVKLLSSSRAIRSVSTGEYGSAAVFETRESQIALPGGAQRAWPAVPGLQCAALVGPSAVLLGKNRGGSIPTALYLAKIQTGELDYLPFDAISAFQVFTGSEPLRAKVFSIDESEIGIATSLWEISLSPFSRRLLDRVQGERFTSSACQCGDGGFLYSFGDRVLRSTQGSEPGRIIFDSPITVRRIAATENAILLVCADQSMEIVDARTKESFGRWIIGKGNELLRLR